MLDFNRYPHYSLDIDRIKVELYLNFLNMSNEKSSFSEFVNQGCLYTQTIAVAGTTVIGPPV